jgi:hypothetical protein
MLCVNPSFLADCHLVQRRVRQRIAAPLGGFMQVPFTPKALPLSFLLSAVVAGCATPIKPDDLAVPKQITCVHLKQPLSASGTYGLNNTWITRLERGPYWSEREDEKGTYYRAPPGGLSIRGPDGKAVPGWGATMDGGFYVPNDPKEPPRIYRYFSTAAAPVYVPPEDADCSSVGYVKDPSTSKVGLMSFAAAGAVGGAAGGLIGRSMTPTSNMSYGQAAGVGAAGGLAAGLLIGAMINADVGKIIGGLPIQEAQFLDQLRTLTASKMPVKELPYAAVGGDAQATVPAQVK